jgi:methionine-rich copper-binding protein CopC
VSACEQPDAWSIGISFERAANGQLPATYPQIPSSTGVRSIPESVLMAVGWVESGWRQFTPNGRPLLSFDFGYGIMQITSGMAGAFGHTQGSLDPATQSMIASNFTYNIAYGARMLAEKWASTPRVGDGDPTVVENWYYALWAYNGWGWVNNPNNKRFSRVGTPATNPSTYPYQERVLYLVAHPPRDAAGNPLWKPVPVALPAPSLIGKSPKELPVLPHTHRQPPAALQAVYRPTALVPTTAGAKERVSVKVTNTGVQPWDASSAVSLAYHVLTATANPWKPLSPFTSGMVAFGQGNVPLHGTVAPGGSRTVALDIRAPASTGQYQIVWDLESGDTYLSLLGALPRVQKLAVVHAVQPNPAPSPLPTARPDRPLDLQYVADTSVPDGAKVAPGKRFTKGWLVFNPGSHPWTTGIALTLSSGKSFGAGTIPLPSTPACRTANVLVSMTAPKRPGQYTSVWRLTGADGKRVGDPLTLVVTVSGNPSGHPTPTPAVPTPTAMPSRPSPTPTPAG